MQLRQPEVHWGTVRALHSAPRQPSEATPQMANIVRDASSLGEGKLPAQIQPAIATATIAHRKKEKIDRTRFMTAIPTDGLKQKFKR